MTEVESTVAVTDEVAATVTPPNSRTQRALTYEDTVAATLIDPEQVLADFAQEMSEKV